MQKKINKDKKNVFTLILPLVNLSLIIFCFFYFNYNTHHPSIITLILIINVCLLIIFSHHNFFIENILTSKLFTKIGLLSYSLYIFHYPLFAFARIIFEKNEHEIVLVIVKIFLPIFLYFISLISNHFYFNYKFLYYKK